MGKTMSRIIEYNLLYGGFRKWELSRIIEYMVVYYIGFLTNISGIWVGLLSIINNMEVSENGGAPSYHLL